MQPLDNNNDPGLFFMGLLLRLLKVDVSLPQLRETVGDAPVGIPDMLRCAKQFGLRARTFTASWSQLGTVPLPVLVTLNNGGFLLLGRHDQDKVVVMAFGAGRPAVMTRANFEANWNGGVVSIEPGRSHAGLLARLRVPEALRTLVAKLRPSPAKSPEPNETRQLTVRNAGAAFVGFVQRTSEHRRTRAISIDKERQRTAELAFLPAALEIVETPPSPVGRAVTYSIIAIFVATLTWSCFGTVDIVSVAPGKIVPSDRTKIIQPFETGLVRAIRVKDGQTVKAGDVLVELDPTVNEATADQVKRDYMGARLTVARLRAALASREDPLAAFSAPAQSSPELAQMHRHFLVSQTTEQKAKLAAIDGQVAQKRAERATIQASIEKLRAALEPLGQRVEARKQLYDKQLGSKLTYLVEFQELVTHQQEIMVQQSRFTETDAAIGALAQNRARTEAEYERTLLEELDKAEQKSAALAQEVIKAEKRTTMQTLTAPVDGQVQQLAVHTVGGVVTPAQSLMLIVPAESRLEIEAMVSNRDIGFVEIGQEAAIKVDTFNFTRYGLMNGTVLSLSQDAITRDKPHDRSNESARGSESSSSEPKGQELIYSARISVERDQMDVDDKKVRLAPGMAVTVEIKTGARRIISYLFSPLLRYKHESLRER